MTPSVKPRLPANIQAAIENVVGLKGGSPRWAVFSASLGVSEAVLRNKVAAERDEKRHHLTLAEAIAMARSSDSPALIEAICIEFGGEFLRHPGIDDASDSELFSRYTNMMGKLGKFSSDIHESLADGKISREEIDTLRKDFLNLTGALSEIMDRLHAKASHDENESKVPPLNRST